MSAEPHQYMSSSMVWQSVTLSVVHPDHTIMMDGDSIGFGLLKHTFYSINLPENSPNSTAIYVSNGNLPLNDGDGLIFLSAVESESHVQTASKMSSQLTHLKNSKTRLKSRISSM